MNCPACDAADSSVIETRCYDGIIVHRRRRCRVCKVAWPTKEIVDVRARKRSTTTRYGLAAAQAQPTSSTPVEQRQPSGSPAVSPAPPSGSVPDPDLIPFSLSSDPDPDARSLVPRATGAPRQERRKLPRPPEYTPEFEAFWSEIGVGSKGDALKAWGQVGRPDAEMLIASWKRYEAIQWPDGIGIPYTATWLRRGDWREQPRPRPISGSGLNAREARNHAAGDSFVARLTGGKP